VIQRLLWLGIGLELAFYAALWAWPPIGPSQLDMAGMVLLIVLCLRGGIALPTFLLATLLRRRDRRVSPLQTSVLALVRECRARFISFAWSQPFQQAVLGPDPAGNAPGVPIVLVHGFACNRGVFVALRRKLASAGIGPVFAVTLEPIFGSIDAMAAGLALQLDAIRQRTGQAKVNVVAHSMGGLVARACMAAGPDEQIERLVTLGSPHHGTELAALGMVACAQQMHRDSDWLASLEARESARARVPALSIYTLNDDLVYPPETSALQWAENVPVVGQGHVALLFSGDIAERVIAFLRSRPATMPAM
jgi:triacylglycerol esterase/lipase EstA (alpha/beta hydrolase family)